ncbi:MAG TPA: FAD-dependent oxidoreductase [Streptosporangiaceae bacterium]|nr:FAD-dependent oxidoreductase [Streptosporangiaceae bacterium]
MTGRSFVVVGAGIIGCMVARLLADADPDAQITVLDRDLAGSGVTRRSAGLFLARGSSPRTKRMSAFSHAYYANLKASHPHLPIFPVDATAVTDGEADLSAFGYLSDLAAPTELADWSKGSPVSSGGSVRRERAWRIGGCHYADVYGVTQAIAELARPRARFAEGVAVTGLSIGRAGVTLHCGTGEHLTADQVVIAPGAWLAAPAWRDLVSPLGLRIKKIVAMHIEQRPDPADEVTLFDSQDAFLLPVHHRGHWLFSYARTEWDVDPDQLTGGLSAADVDEARACLRRCAPSLVDAAASGRVCADAYSPLREPVISLLEGTQERVVFAGGAGGSGYRFAPAIAAHVASVLSEGATDDHQYV